MLDWLRKLLGPPKGAEQNPVLTRNVNDIMISVKEGLSGTREIHVTAWNHDIALQFFRDVRNELRENP